MDEVPKLRSLIRTDVLGVPVDLVDMKSALDQVRAMLTTSSNHVIVAMNPEKVIAAQNNPQLMAVLEKASLVVPDGIGIVVAARLLGKGRMQRVPGSDLMPAICDLAAKDGHRIFLYGAQPHVVTRAATILQQRFPQLSIAGTHHGYVAEEEMPQLIDIINSSGADVLFVGLGSPRQELWMTRFRDQLPNVRVCQGVGGTFDAICGNPPRAPKIVQHLYLEWLYRLVTQPQRLVRQTALPRFAVQVLRKALVPK